MTDFLHIFFFVCLVGLGFVAGCNIESVALEYKLNSVGIKEVRYCSVDTVNAHSNWYEIVWIDKRNTDNGK